MGFNVNSPTSISKVKIGETIYFGYSIYNLSGSTVPDETPRFFVLEENNDTPILSSGLTVRPDFSGCYKGYVPVTSGVGFDVGQVYNVLGSGKVSGYTRIEPILTFFVENNSIDDIQISDAYYAKTNFVVDDIHTQDEYTITWFKNSAPITAGITLAGIRAINRADGSTLFEATGLTQIGSTNVFKHTTSGTNRISVGEAYLVETSGTIDGSIRTWRDIIGRDVSGPSGATGATGATGPVGPPNSGIYINVQQYGALPDGNFCETGVEAALSAMRDAQWGYATASSQLSEYARGIFFPTPTGTQTYYRFGRTVNIPPTKSCEMLGETIMSARLNLESATDNFMFFCATGSQAQNWSVNFTNLIMQSGGIKYDADTSLDINVRHCVFAHTKAPAIQISGISTHDLTIDYCTFNSCSGAINVPFYGIESMKITNNKFIRSRDTDIDISAGSEILIEENNFEGASFNRYLDKPWIHIESGGTATAPGNAVPRNIRIIRNRFGSETTYGTAGTPRHLIVFGPLDINGSGRTDSNPINECIITENIFNSQTVTSGDIGRHVIVFNCPVEKTMIMQNYFGKHNGFLISENYYWGTGTVGWVSGFGGGVARYAGNAYNNIFASNIIDRTHTSGIFSNGGVGFDWMPGTIPTGIPNALPTGGLDSATWTKSPVNLTVTASGNVYVVQSALNPAGSGNQILTTFTQARKGKYLVSMDVKGTAGNDRVSVQLNQGNETMLSSNSVKHAMRDGMTNHQWITGNIQTTGVNGVIRIFFGGSAGVTSGTELTYIRDVKVLPLDWYSGP